MHADRPGDRPRLLYWYRTAPGIVLGRPALDEDAIRTIEEQHPDIDFDWPAILALSEVMTPEEEAPARPPQGKRKRQDRPRPDRDAGRRDRREAPGEAPPAGDAVEPIEPIEGDEALDAEDAEQPPVSHLGERIEPEPPPPPHHHSSYGLLEELAGREIATRLRARFAEITARIHERDMDESLRDAWLKRAEPMNPDLWLTPEAILEGVRSADAMFERLRKELLAAP